MAEKITVGNTTQTLNQSGDSAGWGESQYDLIKQLVETVNSFFGPGDILQTTALIANNITTPTVIPNFQFNVSVTRFAEVEYTVIRIAGTETVYEVGKIFVLNDPVAVGNPWSLNIQNMSNSVAGIELDINSSGQITYTSDDMTSFGTYQTGESKIVFKGKAIIK